MIKKTGHSSGQGVEADLSPETSMMRQIEPIAEDVTGTVTVNPNPNQLVSILEFDIKLYSWGLSPNLRCYQF